MNVPLLDISRQHAPLESEFSKAYSSVFKSGQFILGPEVEALENEIAAYCQCDHGIGLSSGTDALLVALMAWGIGPGDEVLCPTFTFFGTAGCIVRLGATPVWVDVLPDTFNIDLADAESKITEKTKAIIPVHLFGQSCDMDCVLALAEQHNLFVLEDMAQSLGAEYGGKRVGGFGQFGAISFYPTKNLGGFGDGGMLVTDDPLLADKAKWLRNHGMNPKYYHRVVGGNFRLDGIQAAMLRVKLPHLESYHQARAKNAEFYSKELQGHGLVRCPLIRAGTRSVWNQYTLVVANGERDALQAHLRENAIGCEIYYPVSLDQQDCFAEHQQGANSIRVSRELADSVLSIPVFPELREDERQRVVDVIWAFGYKAKS